MYTIFIDVHFLTFNCLQFLRIKLIYYLLELVAITGISYNFIQCFDNAV